MRIVTVVPAFGEGAISRSTLRRQPWNYLLQISRDLASQGHEVIVAVQGTSATPGAIREISEAGVGVAQLGRDVLRGVEALLVPIGAGFVNNLSRAVSGLERFLVVGVLTTPLMSLVDAVHAVFKVVVTGTNVAALTVLKENIAFRLMARRICKVIDELIVPSRDYADLIESIIPCGIRAEVFLPDVGAGGTVREPSRGAVTRIAYFGPFTEERGVVSLVKAFKRLRRGALKEAVVDLLIRPEGSAPLSLLRRAVAGMEGVHVRLRSLSRDELFGILSRSSLIVLPYRVIASTVPLAFLEALELRGPLLLSTTVPGVGEHVRKFLPVRLSPTYDAGELADAVEVLLTDEGLRKRSLERQRLYSKYLREERSRQHVRIER